MTQHFVINGKKYLPSAEVARRFNYTSDYVSRLAREQKIVASNVNRKWFIDIDSFTAFQKSTDAEKEQRAKKLKKIRQKERQLHLHHKVIQKRQEQEHVYIAMAQSFALFVCFAFGGLLGWTVIDSEMSIGDVSFGANQTYQQFAQVIFTGVNSIENMSGKFTTQVIQSKDVQLSQASPSAYAPIPPSFTPPLNTSKRNSDTDTRLFSDEVELLFQEDGVRIVRPVFSDERAGQAYQVTPAQWEESFNQSNE